MKHLCRGPKFHSSFEIYHLSELEMLIKLEEADLPNYDETDPAGWRSLVIDYINSLHCEVKRRQELFEGLYAQAHM